MATNAGMVGWGLATMQNNPIILVIVVGVIADLTYFSWWKKRL